MQSVKDFFKELNIVVIVLILSNIACSFVIIQKNKDIEEVKQTKIYKLGLQLNEVIERKKEVEIYTNNAIKKQEEFENKKKSILSIIPE